MAVTKVSSTVHFVSRGSAVSGRHGAANGRWVPNTDVYATTPASSSRWNCPA